MHEKHRIPKSLNLERHATPFMFKRFQQQHNHKKHTTEPTQKRLSILLALLMCTMFLAGMGSAETQPSQGKEPVPPICSKQHKNAESGIFHCNKDTRFSVPMQIQTSISLTNEVKFDICGLRK
jgi:hypothetical protein